MPALEACKRARDGAHSRRIAAALVVLCLATPLDAAAAGDAWGSIRVPGGAAAMRRMAGLGDGPRQTTSVVLDLTRAYFRASVGGSPEARARFARYIEHVLRLERALSAWPEGLSLAPAPGAGGHGQDALRDTLGLLGLRVRTAADRTTVEPDTGDAATERHRWLAALRIDVWTVAERLNTGEVARLAIPTDDVPLPLPAFWTEGVFENGSDPFLQLVSSRESLFLYYGLMGLDRETLAWFAASPEAVRRIRDDCAVMFGAFGSAVRIRDARIATPGGDSARPIWESLVGAPVTNPVAFLRNLLERHEGRLAYFYATVATADPARQAALLGAHLPETKDQSNRLSYVQIIRDWFMFANADWRVPLQPLSRPAIDPALVVSIAEVNDRGLVGPDWWPSLFDRVARQDGWPSRPRDTMDKLKSNPADALWLLSFVFEEPGEVERRFAWVRFAQRVLSSAPRAAAPDVEIALRALKDMPTLALSLERMGVVQPASLAEIARAARRMVVGSDQDAQWAVRGWQGALATLEQVVRHRPLPPDDLSKLLSSLARAVPSKPPAITGDVAAWFLRDFLPTLGVRPASGDAMEAEVLRGLLKDSAQRGQTLTWEGVTYQVDRLGPAAASAVALRAAMPGPRLADLAALDEAGRRLGAPIETLSELAEIIALVEAALPAWPFGDLADAVKNLGKIRAEKDLPRASRERATVLAAVAGVAADILPAFAYALAMSPATQPARIFADSPRLHELGTTARTGGWESVAWQFGEVANRQTGGTAVRGSLLGLDLVRAADQLVRAPGAVNRPPVGIDANLEITRKILVDRIVLRPSLNWVASGKAAVAAVSRGRDLATAWSAALPDQEQLSRELTRAGISQLRQNQLRWLLERRVPGAAVSFLTLTDLYRLGSSDVLPPGWGQSARAFDGCWCVRGVGHGPIDRFTGYTAGYMAAVVADLPLRLAEVLSDMGIPPFVIEPLLPLAVQDLLDQASQFLPDDWEPLAWAGRLSPERVEEYLQVLVKQRVLAPPSGGSW